MKNKKIKKAYIEVVDEDVLIKIKSLDIHWVCDDLIENFYQIISLIGYDKQLIKREFTRLIKEIDEK